MYDKCHDTFVARKSASYRIHQKTSDGTNHKCSRLCIKRVDSPNLRFVRFDENDNTKAIFKPEDIENAHTPCNNGFLALRRSIELEAFPQPLCLGMLPDDPRELEKWRGGRYNSYVETARLHHKRLHTSKQVRPRVRVCSLSGLGTFCPLFGFKVDLNEEQVSVDWSALLSEYFLAKKRDFDRWRDYDVEYERNMYTLNDDVDDRTSTGIVQEQLSPIDQYWAAVRDDFDDYAIWTTANDLLNPSVSKYDFSDRDFLAEIDYYTAHDNSGKPILEVEVDGKHSKLLPLSHHVARDTGNSVLSGGIGLDPASAKIHVMHDVSIEHGSCIDPGNYDESRFSSAYNDHSGSEYNWIGPVGEALMYDETSDSLLHTQCEVGSSVSLTASHISRGNIGKNVGSNTKPSNKPAKEYKTLEDDTSHLGEAVTSCGAAAPPNGRLQQTSSRKRGYGSLGLGADNQIPDKKQPNPTKRQKRHSEPYWTQPLEDLNLQSSVKSEEDFMEDYLPKYKSVSRNSGLPRKQGKKPLTTSKTLYNDTVQFQHQSTFQQSQPFSSAGFNDKKPRRPKVLTSFRSELGYVEGQTHKKTNPKTKGRAVRKSDVRDGDGANTQNRYLLRPRGGGVKKVDADGKRL